jgi:hypothetical protein
VNDLLGPESDYEGCPGVVAGVAVVAVVLEAAGLLRVVQE